MARLLKSKWTYVIISVILIVALIGIIWFSSNNSNDYVAKIREYSLANKEIDCQTIFNKFDNSSLTKEDNITTFIGEQSISYDLLNSIDNLSEVDKENLANTNVKYTFSYDSETNVVTLQATMVLPDGTVEIDEIQGVAFINDKNEIDAVMNIEGDAMLLSEMQAAGMIDNTGWFSKLIKKVAKIVAVAAVAVAAVAVVVVTAGAAAPAVVAAGIGVTATVVSTAAVTATAIAAYATITAAIAAGVAITASLVDKYYPNAGATDVYEGGKKVVKVKWNEATQTAVKDIVICKTKENPKDPAIYFPCNNSNNNPKDIILSPITKTEMANLMRTIGKDSLTFYGTAASSVLTTAFAGAKAFTDNKTGLLGIRHMHATYSILPNGNPNPNDNRVMVNGLSVHSFYFA